MLKIERVGHYQDRVGQIFKTVGGRLMGSMSLQPDDMLEILSPDGLSRVGFCRLITVLHTRYTDNPAQPWTEWCIGYENDINQLNGCYLKHEKEK